VKLGGGGLATRPDRAALGSQHVGAGDILRRIRASVPANALVRGGLRTLAALARRLDDLADRWRVSGTPTVTLQGAEFRMLGRADDLVLDLLYYRRDWEAAETRLFATLVRDAGVVLDIGANTGAYSLMAARLAPSARIIAVEPHPANAERLRANLELNGARRVSVIEAAAGATEGSLALTIPADGAVSDVASGVGAFSRAHYGIPYTTVVVAQTTIDRIVADQRLERVDLIKLDVEYFELEALRGAVRTLTRFAPVVLAEVFDYEVFTGDMPALRGQIAQDNSRQVEALMSAHGYTFFAIGANGILRTDTLRAVPDGRSNYLFVKDPPAHRYMPYADADAIRALAGSPPR
jgi:FkbM family methyltransferase